MSGTHYGIIDGLLKRVADTEKERDAAYAERDLHIRAGELMAQEIEKLNKHIEGTAKDTHRLLVAAEAKVEKLRAALQSMPSVVRHTTVCQGPSWPDDRPGVWIAALTACENAVQEAVDAALTTEERHDG